MPKVSVVIPNFNHAQFLERRFKTVLDQTFQDFEIIYLDDGSTDNSAQVFARFSSDPRIRAVLNEANGGIPFKQWNKGVRLARGEYVWIAESDDYADSRFLARLVPVLDGNPGVGLVYCHSLLVDEGDTVRVWPTGLHWQEDFVNGGKDECRNYFLFGNAIPNASSVLIRRSIYEQAGYADESMKFCGDWLMWVNMLLISDLAFISEPLNYYRRHPGSVSSRIDNTAKSLEERYRIAHWIKQNLPVSDQLLDQACQSMMDIWFRMIRTAEGGRGWRCNEALYKLARDVDPKLRARFLQGLWVRKARLLSPVQSGWLLPGRRLGQPGRS
jgi:glycosyltransferase involved in cell wall biosynthesis